MCQFVPAQQPSRLPVKIAFVGEAPSHEEMEQCKPFVGPSGQVFDALLRTAGLERAEHLVTNVFNEQCDANDCEAWMRDPATADRHLARLAWELEAAQPNVVVPLGGTALWALTGSTAISQARGAVQAATRTLPGAKLLPTYHPALVMRQWQHFHIVVGDLIRAAQEAERGPQIVWPRRELLLDPSLQDLAEWLDKLRTADLLSVDIETGWGQITCIGFAPSVEEAIVVPFVDWRKPTRNYWSDLEEEEAAWRWVKVVLENPVPKLGQNYGAYDAYWLLARMGIRTRNLLHDTRILHHALYPELEKSLAFMGNSYGSQGAWKTMRAESKTEKRDD